MGRIKSALEIALERTESVKSDRAGIENFEARQQGKRLANEFLEDPTKSLEEALKKASKEARESLKQGIFDVLFAQINLPASRDDEKRLDLVGKGLQVIIGDSRFSSLYKQFTQIISRYLNEAAQYEEAIKRQYAPKLRKKEEDFARRTGRQVQLDPFQDPEFIAFYHQHLNALKENYQAPVQQIQEQARLLFEKHAAR
ncbi:MAG: hypothetical protein LBP88_05150 [Treponema sp.]|jgi:hypothetical protein|nr:hypothetical protein [Treponema sp.]